MKRSSLFLAIAIFSTFTMAAGGQGYAPTNYSLLRWRSVGPARGGRSVAVTGVKSRPNEFYFGATGGGLWKSTNAGESWSCVSDGSFTTASVGAVAVSESNPDVVYAGTGERDIRGDISHGDGIYKSTDGGNTWQHIGLETTQTISKIQIRPDNPDVVYVAALGHVYGPNPDRGVFKSTDGGKTWNKILFESDRAGAVDLCMDPSNPDTLYAATWEAWRTPYTLNSGGPGSKLYKTTDGGQNWTDLSRAPGMPKGILGKIGLSVSPVKPDRVWANVEAEDGGIFRSDDGGKTWQKVNDDRDYRQRAWYYTHLYADPKLADTVYVVNVGFARSTNGGKTWTDLNVPHGDNHDLWINPADTNRMIESNDGGATVTTDGGKTWTQENYPTAELYHVVADNHFPYRIYGAQQDNSTVRLDPGQPGGGRGFGRRQIQNWQPTAGGESGYIAVKPDDPDVVYGGSYGGVIMMMNDRTGLFAVIDPWPDNPMGHAAKDLKHRFQWTFPIVTSPHDPNVLYTSSQCLLKTTNGGHSWQRISPDLTRNDPSTLGSSGGPITKDNTSVEYYGTIFTVAESPVRRGVIWTGSDDGLVHVTQNGGGSWADVTPKDMPHWGRVSMVDPSALDAGTAYIAVNNYQNDDYAPYLYRTHDYGRTWTKIVTGIPAGAFARVCRADPKRKGLLYAGTETGAYVSFDDGDHWQTLQMNLPVCPVHDLIIKNSDLIAATHGRSFWILDNISLLEHLSPEAQAKPVVFPPKDPYRVNTASVEIDYYLPAQADSLKLEILGADGKVITSYDGSGRRALSRESGVHRFQAQFGYPAPHTFPGMILWTGGRRQGIGAAAPPGPYTIRLTAGKETVSCPFRLLKDPRVPASEKDLAEQYAFSKRIIDRISAANDTVVKIRDLKKQIDTSVQTAKNDSQIKTAGTALNARLSAVEGEIYQVQNRTGEDPLNFPIMLNDRLTGLLGVVQSGSMRPSEQTYQVFDALSALLQVQLDALQGLLNRDLAALNQDLQAKGLAAIKPSTVAADAQSEPATRGRREEDDGE